MKTLPVSRRWWVVFLLMMPIAVVSQKVNAAGIGHSTGQEGTLYHLQNKTEETMVASWGPFLIFYSSCQGYLIPDPYEMKMAFGSTVRLWLRGLCTHPFLSPLSKGADLPSFCFAGRAADKACITPIVCLRPDARLRPAGICFDPIAWLTYPGADIPFSYPLNRDTYPEIAVLSFIDMRQAVERIFRDLSEAGCIAPPLISVREEAVAQQLSILAGHRYEREDFQSDLIGQFESQTNTEFNAMLPLLQVQLEKGPWGGRYTFISTLVGIETKIIRATAAE